MPLCLHTITNRPWTADECIRKYAEAGVEGVTFWRRDFEQSSADALGRRARDAGLAVVSLARGGFFPSESAAGRREAIDDNRRAIDEAAACGAPVLVLVCGAVPGQPLDISRAQIADGIRACADHAAAAGVQLAIEPLHPMYADSRSAVVTMRQALDLCFEVAPPDRVAVACDVYHVWWDDDLRAQIARAGRSARLAAFHICDWKTPTLDLLEDRGIPGEGCIDLRGIDRDIAAAGFDGFREVEIFSAAWWRRDQDEFLAAILEACRRLGFFGAGDSAPSPADPDRALK